MIHIVISYLNFQIINSAVKTPINERERLDLTCLRGFLSLSIQDGTLDVSSNDFRVPFAKRREKEEHHGSMPYP